MKEGRGGDFFHYALLIKLYTFCTCIVQLIIFLQLEQQLRTCSEQIKQYAPVVHDIAAKVKQLLSQS